MEKKSRILEKLYSVTDLDDESLPGVPLVEILGQERVLIENHFGIVGYGSCCVGVKVKFGRLCIYGADLQLRKMTKNQLFIFGRIDRIELIRGV